MIARRLSVAALVVLALTTFTRVGAAQELRGTVRDSVSRRPIAGAVLLVLDSSGMVLVRNLTDETGRYAIAVRSGARRVRVQRIGFRPRDMVIPARATATDVAFDVVMLPIPTFLERVSINAQSKCSRRADRAVAFALLQQARAGLLTTIVARETNPAAMVRFTYEKTMAGMSDHVDYMTVFVDSADRTSGSFGAAHKAIDFVRGGFVEAHGDDQTFLGPDAEVLLDDDFAAAYCFHIADPETARANEVGLGFVPAERREKRVDIEGVLWIDTVARALRDIQFRYVGLESTIQRAAPGGSISFREMANGVVLIDQWSLRLVGIDRHGSHMHESGGVLANTEWPDGHTWHATLPSARLHVVTTQKQPAVGVQLWLADTPYGATVDSSGTAVIHDLIPGPYSVVVADPRLRPLDLDIPTKATFVALRDSVVEMPVDAMTAEEFVIQRCVHDRRFRPGDSSLLLGRVVTRQGQPVDEAVVSVERQTAPNTWQPFGEYRTGGDGLFSVCTSVMPPGTEVRATARRNGSIAADVQAKVTGPLTVVRIAVEATP
jgi:hypothetical protein